MCLFDFFMHLTCTNFIPHETISYTVEPVYLDSGKCEHLHKADAKSWSQIASYLPTLSTHLQFTDTTIF